MTTTTDQPAKAVEPPLPYSYASAHFESFDSARVNWDGRPHIMKIHIYLGSVTLALTPECAEQLGRELLGAVEEAKRA